VAYALRKVDLLSFHLRYILLQILLRTTITNEENVPEWGLSILSHNGLALIRDSNMGYPEYRTRTFCFQLGCVCRPSDRGYWAVHVMNYKNTLANRMSTEVREEAHQCS
jgi:hypothetical protein